MFFFFLNAHFPLLLPWNQRSLQIYYRAVEWTGSSHELFSIVASARFDTGCSDTYRVGGREKRREKERKREDCRWFPANALLAHRWCAWYKKFQCLISEVKRTRSVHWGDSPMMDMVLQLWLSQRVFLGKNKRCRVILLGLKCSWGWDIWLLSTPARSSRGGEGKCLSLPLHYRTPSPTVESALSPSTLCTPYRLPPGT